MNWLYWSLLLLGAGFVVIGLELFIPSAGVLGLVAASFLVGGLIMGFADSWQTGMWELFAVLVMLPVLLGMLIRVWPHTPIGRRILIGPTSADEVVPRGGYYDEIKLLVGRLGVVKTKMLPSGIIVVDGKKYDATSDGFPLDPGDTVRVSSVKGNRIFVTRYEGDSADVDNLPARDSDLLNRSLEDFGLDPMENPLG